MKQSILFMVINMNVGGTERSLLNRIAEMPENQYDITILMLEKRGGFLASIPAHVKVTSIDEYPTIKEMLNSPLRKMLRNNFQKDKRINDWRPFFRQLGARFMRNRGYFLNYVLKNTPNLPTAYDVAVAYAGPMDLISYFVCHKINAKKKVQWIHFDVTKIDFDVSFAAKIYRQFDQVYAVSQEGRDKLIDKLPKLKAKIDFCANLIEPERITEKAEEGKGFTDHFPGVRILTVGRLSKEKGQDVIIPVLAKLKESGFPVRWYCIGEGSAQQAYEQLIKKYQLESDFILLGAMSNPYPFMKQCDLYVQPSRHEGYCLTLAEARCFSNPIITTNFTGAHEQLSQHANSIIVDVDEQQIYAAVQRMIERNDLPSAAST
ncbi:glycosyltransferase [Gracilibacillus phocaeensis]|uniref:glycosyltransferase n=1 Tax=Gracilibacillus phocaeensis TaxID=2042304 RepID=UPI0013EF3069|nr:glycosyltransferase [Gracilibacillus phocaeensis]